MYQQAGLDPMPADLAINFGVVYNDQADYAHAIPYFEKALAAFEKSQGSYGQFQALDGLGKSYFQMGSFIKAIEYFEQAVKLEEKINAKPDMVDTLRGLGDTYFSKGDMDAAYRSYERAEKVAADQDDPNKKVVAKVGIARNQLARGKAAEAVVSAEQAAASFESIIGHGSSPDLYDTLGRAYLAAGDTRKAREAFDKAIKDVESEQNNASASVDEGASFFGRRMAPFRALTALLLSQGQNELAFAYAERARSRSLIETLQNGKVDNTGAMTAAEKRREQELRSDLVSLNTQISKLKQTADAGSVAKLLGDQREKRVEFEDFTTRTYAVHPELRVHRGEMKPIGLEETGLLTEDRSVLLEYAVAEDKTFLFAITRDTATKPSLRVYTIEAKAKEIADRVEGFRSKMAKGDLDFGRDARELYDLLLKPAAESLKGRTSIIIVPDSSLWNLPFQALQNANGKYLTEQAAVSYAPSLTALREMQKRTRGKTTSNASLLAFGNPAVNKATSDRLKTVFMDESLEPLPEAERLVNTLSAMYGPRRSKVYVGADAREKTAKGEAPKYRIVQFATHGILNNTSPMYSHLVLSQKQDDPNEDGLLEAWELKDLDLKADMVILSACDTARGRISSGEGVIGMTWASFIAGAPTTVASQWKVESSSTTELMLEFHRQLLSGIVSKAEALRRAELKLLRNPKYSHPSYWGGWVLVGNGN
jgi:CHAT domain-containing protein